MEDIIRARLMQPELQLIDENELEADREYLMQMYPARARLIMVMVEDACDRLEYEGSPMFAQFPDKEYMLGISRNIYNCSFFIYFNRHHTHHYNYTQRYNHGKK